MNLVRYWVVVMCARRGFVPLRGRKRGLINLQDKAPAPGHHPCRTAVVAGSLGEGDAVWAVASRTSMKSHVSPMAVVIPSVFADAPAKLNLTLDVLGSRPDGYHELRSLVIGVDLRDHVNCRATQRPGIAIRCSDVGLAGGDNLCCRAARLLADRVGGDSGVAIDLEKRIPVGGGLGGGSSDAAATLRLCNTLWSTALDDAELAALGAEIGSDVPLFFSLPSAIVSGRGEIVTPVAMRWSGWVLLVSAPVLVSTAEVYRAWLASDARGLPRAQDDAVTAAEHAEQIMPLLSNHLQRAVFRVAPEVARVYDAVEQAGWGPMRVTGAGSTIYRLFDGEEAARDAAAAIDRLHLGTTTHVAAAPTGPSPITFEES